MKISPRQELVRKLPAHVEGEVLVRLAEPQDRVTLESQLPVRVLEQFELPQLRSGRGELLRLALPAGMSTAEGIARLEQDPRFEYVTSNDLRRVSKVADDDLASELWGMEKIAAPQAWERSVGSRSGPVVAVLDTGVDLQHPDLIDNLWTNPGEVPGNGVDDDGNGVIDDVHGYNAVRQSGDPDDDYGHGTHCAGTLGAVGDNQQGVVGVNWQARLMPVKMMENGEGTVADTLRAVAYATRMGARITSNSYGGGFNPAERDAFESSPLLHLCAAGNEANDNDVSPFYPEERPLGYPGNYAFDHVVSVAASNPHDRLASFSNYGVKNVDLAAPGTATLSTVPGGGYDTKSGTSMATPHVAGVATLIASLYPQASNREIRTRLLANVDPVPGLRDKVATGGRLNAARALEDDRLPPNAPGQLQASPSDGQLQVSWINSGDDGDQGQAYRVHLDYDGRQWSLPAGQPGQPQQFTVPLGVGQGELQLRSEDNVGQLGPAAAVQVDSPLREVELQWQSETWGLDAQGHWTDSPQGPYANRADSQLVSDWICLDGPAQLRFAARHRLEPGADYVHLEAQRQGDDDWKKLEEFTSFREWQDHSVDLSSLQEAPFRLRFRLTSDGSKVEDGFVLKQSRLLC